MAMQPLFSTPCAALGSDPQTLMAPAPHLRERRMEKIRRLIADGPHYDVAALAATVNLSPSRLQHLFKTHYGVSIRDCLLQRRLDKAVLLLTTTDMRIKQITFAIGYGHCSSFVRAFRKQFAQTPEHYRQRAESANQ